MVGYDEDMVKIRADINPHLAGRLTLGRFLVSGSSAGKHMMVDHRLLPPVTGSISRLLVERYVMVQLRGRAGDSVLLLAPS